MAAAERHTDEEIMNMTTTTSLNHEDWKFFKSIYKGCQTTVSICNCSNTRTASVKFQLEAIQQFPPSHPASGLGNLHTRFKCSAYKCNKSAGAIGLLKAYLQSIKNKRPRTESPSPTSTVTQENLRMDWNDFPMDLDNDASTEADFLPAAPETPAQSLETQHSPGNAQVDSSNQILSMLTSFRRETIDNQIRQSNRMTELIDLVATLTTKNQELESKLAALTTRIANLEDTYVTTPPQPLSPSLSSPQPVAQVVKTTWASVAAASPVARQKAIENSQLSHRQEGFTALKDLLRKRAVPTAADVKTSVVYVAGFEFAKYGILWKALRSARFQTSRIFSMQWIGKSILECVVAADYKVQFSAEIEVAGCKIRDFDASKNVNAVSAEQVSLSKRNFIVRCIKNILFARNEIARNHFKKVADAACAADEEHRSIFENEFAVAKQAKISMIQDLVEKIQSGDLEIQEYHKCLKELTDLDPQHAVVQAENAKLNASTAPMEVDCAGEQ